MATTVNRKRELSSSASSGSKYSKSEAWQVLSDTITEPEDARNASGLPTIGSLVSGTNMRCSKIRAELDQIGRDGVYVWTVNVDYDSPEGGNGGIEPTNGTEIWTITGQMGGETVKMALAQDAMTGSPDVGLLVGVKDDGTVEGGPWGVPTVNLSITLYKTKSAVTSSYITGCIAEVGKVNSSSFYGFDAGEVRLEGISIPKKLEDLWALQFDFAIRKNEAQASLPSYDAPNSETLSYSRDVKGWEYPWIREIEAMNDTDNNKQVLAEGLYIAKFFKESSFSALGLSGSLF